MDKLRYGMVGGGPGAAVGEKHRSALTIEGRAELVAGCFSQTHEKTLALGAELGLDPARCYENALAMAEAESARDDGIDFVVIVTPNASHFELSETFLTHGIPVVCDKPVTINLAQAQALATLIHDRDIPFMVSLSYMGNPSAEEARRRIAEGAIGEVRMVNAEFPHGSWSDTDAPLAKRHQWRIDPTIVGPTNCLGDLGTHVESIARMITGLTPQRVFAEMDGFRPESDLDNNDIITVEYANGARGMFWTSQIAMNTIGALWVRIYGSKGSLFWSHNDAERYRIIDSDWREHECYVGYGRFDAAADAHPELIRDYPLTWFKAQARLYSLFIDDLLARRAGAKPNEPAYPTIDDGVVNMAFIDACLRSQASGTFAPLDSAAL